MPSCKATGCVQAHDKHFCRNCGNADSDHLARNCTAQMRSKKRCKVRNCVENHSRHFCRLCQDRDSNHKCSACPHGRLVMHATRKEHLPSIAKTGLKPSAGGRLGPGIYFFSEEYDKRNMIQAKGGALLCCNVYLGNTKYLNDGSDGSGSWRRTHDSCQARHPGYGDKPFNEWCIKDHERCKILSVSIPQENINCSWKEYLAKL